MTQFHVIILGIIEGLTEFLPISSTGHLVLASHFLHLEQSDFLLVFEIAIQLGAILAVVTLYFKQLFEMKNIINLIVGFIPTGIAGILIFPHLKALLESPLIVATTLVLGGIIIILVENYFVKHATDLKHTIGWKDALYLGLYQIIAMIPGVSRSGAMIVGGLLMKFDRKVLTEFTFLLAVPTMFAATLYSVYKNLPAVMANGNVSTLLLGSITAYAVALLVIKLFLGYIRKHSFKVFGVYRIILGFIAFLVFFPR